MSELPKGKIQTVCGPIDPHRLGITLCHEHLFFDNQPIKPTSDRKLNPKYAHLNSGPATAERMWWTVYHPYTHTDNGRFAPDQVRDIINDEMRFYKDNGGGTVVEVTTFGKYLSELRSTSMLSGVNIVAGAGYYEARAMSESVKAMSVETIYNSIKNDLVHGDGSGAKCGVIGEIASAWPIHPFEKRCLVATGQAYEDLRAPIIVHPGRAIEAPAECLRIIQEAGGRADKVVMSHLERTFMEVGDLLEFAKLGAYNEMDLFGNEISYFEINDELDFPNDATRIKMLKALIDEGYGKKITIAHDIHTRHRLMKFGGHGYSHILLNTVPKMKMRGYTEDNINDILVENPKEWLTI